MLQITPAELPCKAKSISTLNSFGFAGNCPSLELNQYFIPVKVYGCFTSE